MNFDQANNENNCRQKGNYVTDLTTITLNLYLYHRSNPLLHRKFFHYCIKKKIIASDPFWLHRKKNYCIKKKIIASKKKLLHRKKFFPFSKKIIMSSKIFSVFFSRTWIGTVLRVGGTTEFFEFIFKLFFKENYRKNMPF